MSPTRPRTTAARKPQVNRGPKPDNSTDLPTPEPTPEHEETQEERDAAGLARAKQVRTPGEPESVPDYEPKHKPLDHAGFDHHATEEERQAELDAAREEHNRRTGDGSIR